MALIFIQNKSRVRQIPNNPKPDYLRLLKGRLKTEVEKKNNAICGDQVL